MNCSPNYGIWAPVLKYYDVNAVLLQGGQPVANASKATTVTQQRYPQIRLQKKLPASV
jgi:hypothetical protein